MKLTQILNAGERGDFWRRKYVVFAVRFAEVFLCRCFMYEVRIATQKLRWED